MRRYLSVAALLGLTCLLPTGGAAQMCTGGPALGSVSVGNVGVGVSFFDGGKTYSGGATFGRALFASGSFYYTDYDNTELSFKQVSGTVGYEVTSPGSSLSFCPMVGVSRGFGLEIAGIDVTTVSVSPALAVGLTADVSPTVKVTPFAEGALYYHRTTADAGPLGDAAETQTDGAAVLGVGFSFNDKLTLGPVVQIPIGADNGNTVFGIGLAIAVGSRR